MMNFEMILKAKDTELKNKLYAELKNIGYTDLCNKEMFLYAKGNYPVMFVAHLDTVHKNYPSIICYSENKNYIMSPQGIGGDDRCGVYIILQLLSKLKFKPYVLFTMGEEVGGIGANKFLDYIGNNIPDLNYIIEYDRKGGNDCVFYDCNNTEFEDFIESFGFKTNYGTYSDISDIAPYFGVAAVNISSGYYNPHTEHEYISMKDMSTVIKRSLKLLNAEPRKFEYIRKVAKYYDQYYYDIEAMILEPDTALISCGNRKRYNERNEVAIDQYGNTYVKSYLDNLYYETKYIAPVENDFPEYDYKNEKIIEVLSWGKEVIK